MRAQAYLDVTDYCSRHGVTSDQVSARAQRGAQALRPLHMHVAAARSQNGLQTSAAPRTLRPRQAV